MNSSDFLLIQISLCNICPFDMNALWLQPNLPVKQLVFLYAMCFSLLCPEPYNYVFFFVFFSLHLCCERLLNYPSTLKIAQTRRTPVSFYQLDSARARSTFIQKFSHSCKFCKGNASYACRCSEIRLYLICFILYIKNMLVLQDLPLKW